METVEEQLDEVRLEDGSTVAVQKVPVTEPVRKRVVELGANGKKLNVNTTGYIVQVPYLIQRLFSKSYTTRGKVVTKARKKEGDKGKQGRSEAAFALVKHCVGTGCSCVV